jgi:hypothetical protein
MSEDTVQKCSLVIQKDEGKSKRQEREFWCLSCWSPTKERD